jgi:hypothetical protein
VLSASSGVPAPRAARPADPPNLQQVTQAAGMIFLGRVEKVQWQFAPNGGRADRVKISFQVLDGIRGARTGAILSIDEWPGLWTPGHERYQPGETLMLFFYPRSRLGLTSPVGGESGRLEITPARRIVISPEQAEVMLSRSLRLQKGQAVLDAMRGERAPHYDEFARIVRELAGVVQP